MINLKQAIMKKSIFLLLCISVLFSCTKKEDFFDPHHIDEEAKENFPVENIDPNHNWEMAGVGNMTVSIKDGTGETYKLGIYTDNPLNKENNACLLKEVTIKDGEKKSFSFDMPVGLDFVYAVRQSSDYTRAAMLVFNENGQFILNLDDKTGRAREASGVMPRAMSVDYPTPSFTIPSDANKVDAQKDPWGKHTITIVGNCYVEGDTECDNIIGTGHLYIKNGTLTVNKGQENTSFLQLGQGQNISVLKEAELICKADKGIWLSNGNIYNQGTITVDNKDDNLDDKIYIETSGFILDNGSFVYNQGIIEIEDEFIAISNAKFVNASEGKLKGDDVILSLPSGTFYNEPDATVELDDVLISGGQWLNEGKFDADDFNISGANYELQNTCKLTVEELLFQTNVTFSNSGYIKCEEAKLGQGTVLMTSNSILEIEEADFFSDFKIKGPDSGNDAFLIMDEAKPGEESSGSPSSYSGKLTVVCNDYFEKKSNHPSRPIPANWPIYNEESKKIDVPKTECSDGHHQEVVPPTPVARQVYTYVFEDMTREAGDFDFNDVVLKVTVPDESGKATVTLFAAGATKNLWVGYKNNDLFGEVHTAMGCEPGTLINTGSGPNVAPVEKEITIAGTLKQNGDFYIYDENKIEIHIASMVSPESTYPPYGLCIPGDWEFPKERNKITGLYRYFENWVQDYTVCTRWYEEHMQEFKSAWDAANGEYPYADK